MRSESILPVRAKAGVSTALITALVGLFALIMVSPLFVVLATAFKTDAEVALASFSWLPRRFSLDNFKKVLSMGSWGRYFYNSLVVTVATVAGSLVFNSLAGYTFARMRFRGKNFLFLLIMLGMMIPPQAIVIPQFVILRSVPFLGGNDWMGQGGIGLLNTNWALIIPFLSGSFGIFLCRQFYTSFPKELDEAARIDGCGSFGIYARIFLPMSKQILATLCILKTAATWNDFFYPLIMTQQEEAKTVQLALQMFKGTTSTHWNWLMAGTLLTMIPVVIVFLCAQKYFVAGIAHAGMKN